MNARLRQGIAAIAAAMVVAGPTAGARAWQGGAQGQPSVAQVKAGLENQAGAGNFDFEAAQKALTDAGLNNDQITAEIQKLSKINKGAQQDQNASGTADWNLGQLYRGQTYHMKFPLENKCRIGQTVTITYPTEITLTGPASVFVPPKSKVEVDLTWKVSDLSNVPPPPWPIGVDFQCTPVHGSITMEHPESGGKQVTALGTYRYVCHGMKRTYSIYAHLHVFPRPNDDGGGGGPKKPKKKTHPTCNTLWSAREFQPDATHHSPDDCRGDFQLLAHDMLENQVPKFRDRNPSAWGWLPPASAIDRMSSADLMALHEHADSVARGRKP